MRLLTIRLIVLSVIYFVIPAKAPLFAQESLVLYDNFNLKRIDPDKWVVRQSGGDAGREYVREIASHHLRLVNGAYGDTNASTGGRFDGTFLDFPDSIINAVTGFKATIRVSKFKATGCSTNPGGTRVELHGTFFNTDTPTPGSHVNDVRAAVVIQRLSNSTDPDGVLRVFGRAVHCLDASCASGTVLGFQDLGTANRGDKVTLMVSWDPENNRFTFQRDDQPAVFSPYMVSDAAPSGAKRKGLLVASFPSNCLEPTRPFAFMEALIDNVFVNTSPAHPEVDDDFSDNLLDPNLWYVLDPLAGTVAEVNQRLEITLGPGGPLGTGVGSKYRLVGDFDAQVDYTLLNWPSPNFHSLRLGVGELGVGPGGGIGINRSSFPNSLVSADEFYLLALPNSTPQAATTHPSGTLRLVRQGSTLSGYIRDGGNWVLIGSGTVPLSPTRINLDLGSGSATAPGGVKAAFDNFRLNSGTIQ